MESKKIKELLISLLPNKFILVRDGKSFGGKPYIGISIAQSDYEINGVRGQYYEHISLCLEDGKLIFQPYGGSGGRRIYRKPDRSTESEKYLALGCEIMPAIRIKDTKKALEKVCKDYIERIEKIKREGLNQI